MSNGAGAAALVCCAGMRTRLLVALAAGVLAAFVVTALPALATSQSVAAVDRTGWNPATVSIEPGESVTWSNGTGFAHNVCVRAAGATSGCGEYRSGDPTSSWPSGGYTHTFASDGTYAYICEAHPGMKGTITVGTGVNPPTGTGTGTGTGTNTGTGTGTTTSPAPYPQPTDTSTAPTQTQPAPAAADRTAPRFTSSIKHHASRKALVVELTSSEDATLSATVLRRARHGRSFRRVGRAALHVKKGRNAVALPRKARGSLRSGAYRVQLQLVDLAGNRSPVRTISFKLT